MGYSTGINRTEAEAFADNTLLVAKNRNGIQLMMKRTNEWIAFNNIRINASKSTYHWRIPDESHKAKLKIEGQNIQEEGQSGHFTYLGWTTNMDLDWTVQSE